MLYVESTKCFVFVPYKLYERMLEIYFGMLRLEKREKLLAIEESPWSLHNDNVKLKLTEADIQNCIITKITLYDSCLFFFVHFLSPLFFFLIHALKDSPLYFHFKFLLFQTIKIKSTCFAEWFIKVP